ncbi:MAG: cyclic 2,3-diphosphoglycerate synthase [Burkholderiaceae bacterium]|nr:cyclic 2,3-diphosphoglycerate synthase [Burkholderiaceae bacterium]
MTRPTRILILGAAGRDFHNFNQVYRDDPGVEVVAFTAAQIPGIAGRRYPPELAGPHYPAGIPIEDEAQLEALCRERGVDRVVFAYSDVTHAHVMHCASRALASGCDVSLLGPAATMLASSRPVIAISAVRTGCGKSQIARWLSSWLRERGWRVAVLRHPMPYGDLVAARAQRFATMADLDAAGCTAEEREEYEPHLAAGNLVFAGVDYAEVLRRAEAEADLVVWDGGNNDFPFVRPGLHLVLADALRPDQVDTHHPGETVARMADALIVNKVDAAEAPAIEALEQRLRAVNAHAPIVRAASPVRLDDPQAVAGRRVLVVEDGPTITHGGMASGAGYVAALAAGPAAIVDPRPFADGSLAATYAAFPHIGPVLPAMGYGAAQRAELARCIAASGAEAVVAGTPIDLASMLGLAVAVVRARYRFEQRGGARLDQIVGDWLSALPSRSR